MELRFWQQLENVSRKLIVFSAILTLGLQAFSESKEDGWPEIKFEKSKIEIISANKKNKKIITVELAKTPDQQQRGLMFRMSLPKDEGMFFIFSEQRPLAFWMKNTYVPLDIAYINKDFKIVDIQQMQPASSLLRTEPPSYPSKEPAMYALEMNKGWFKKNKFKVGDSIKLLNQEGK